MIFHENRLLVDNSYEISYLIYFKNWERCRKNLSPAAVVIGALRVNCVVALCVQCLFLTVPWVGLQSVIVAFPGHAHLLSGYFLS